MPTKSSKRLWKHAATNEIISMRTPMKTTLPARHKVLRRARLIWVPLLAIWLPLYLKVQLFRTHFGLTLVVLWRPPYSLESLSD